MRKTLAAAFAALILGIGLVWTQPTGAWIAQVPVVTASYTGPGDIVSGWKWFYGLRGYNAAYSTGSNPAVKVRRESDNTTQNINILSDGNLDIAAYTSFDTSTATCTGTISSTTLTISSCSSGAIAVRNRFTGAGITQPAYVTSIGTCGSPPGTCTINAAQTVSVGETITFFTSITVDTIFDQSGANQCSAAPCDGLASGNGQLFLFPSCDNSLPCMLADGNRFQVTTNNITSVATPWTAYAVIKRQATSGNMAAAGDSSDGFFVGASSAAATARFADNTNQITAAMTDNASHVIMGVETTAGTSSIASIDNVDTTGTMAHNVIAAKQQLGRSGGGANWIGLIWEAGLPPGAVSSGNRTSLCHSAFVYWGTSVSC